LTRFAAAMLMRAFGIKEERLQSEFMVGHIFALQSGDSGMPDLFFCQGMVGVLVAIYLQ